MEIRDRVIERRRVKGANLTEHPEQYRIHGERQTGHMTAQFEHVGQVDAVYVVERDGALVLIDGHLRAAIADDAELRVEVTDLTDHEARLYMIAKAEIGKQADEDPALKLEVVERVPVEELEATGIGEVEIAELRVEGGSETPEDGAYTQKVESPIYEPSGPCPDVADLRDRTKADQLIASIEQADLPPDLATFLKDAAERHVVFRFDRVANYYAHAPTEIQELMQQSALVIVDFKRAIEDGFVRLDQAVMDAFAEDYPDA